MINALCLTCSSCYLNVGGELKEMMVAEGVDCVLREQPKENCKCFQPIERQVKKMIKVARKIKDIRVGDYLGDIKVNSKKEIIIRIPFSDRSSAKRTVERILTGVKTKGY